MPSETLPKIGTATFMVAFSGKRLYDAEGVLFDGDDETTGLDETESDGDEIAGEETAALVWFVAVEAAEFEDGFNTA